MKSVYSAVRTGSLNDCLRFVFKGSMVYMSTLPWSRLVTGLLLLKSKFGPRSVPVKFVMDEVAVGQVCLIVFLFSLSLSFRQSFLFFIICMLLLSEGQAGGAWESLKKHCSFVNRANWIHIKHMDTFWKHNIEFLKVKPDSR